MGYYCNTVLIQKLLTRKAILSKSSLREKEKEKWMKVCVPEMMSSEESEGEVIKVKMLDWRSSATNNFFSKLDKQGESSKSEQAKRQTKERVLGGSSSRPKPSTLVVPSWSLQ